MKSIKRMIVALMVVLTITTVIPMYPSMEGTTVQAATKVKLNKSSTYVIKGSTVKLYMKGTSRKVQWKSSNKKIATVSSKGVVKGVKKGSTTITAKVNGRSYKCKVTVETPSLNKKSVTIDTGKTTTVKLQNSKQKITWESSNKKVAVVSSKGVIKGIKKGTATITAKVGGKKYTCVVTVKTPIIAVKSIALSSELLKLEKGKTYALKATVSPSNATDSKVTWKSSDATVASVDSKGNVTAKATGVATITASAGKAKATCKVIVTDSVLVSNNLVKLKNYIDSNGSTDSNNDKAISWTESVDEVDISINFVHELSTDKIRFVVTMKSTDTEAGITMYVDKAYNNISVKYALKYDTLGISAEAKATFDAMQYTPDEGVYFSLISASGLEENGMEESDIQIVANMQLILSMAVCDLLLQEEMDMTLEDIGFSSYQLY